MTKDEIKARIEGCRAELDGLDPGAGESGESDPGGATRRDQLEREIAGLEALLAEG